MYYTNLNNWIFSQFIWKYMLVKMKFSLVGRYQCNTLKLIFAWVDYSRRNNCGQLKNIYVKMSMMLEVSESLRGSNMFNLCKILNMTSCFSTIRWRLSVFYLLIFFLLFSKTVDIQHQVFHSIITVSNNTNSKQSS